MSLIFTHYILVHTHNFPCLLSIMQWCTIPNCCVISRIEVFPTRSDGMGFSLPVTGDEVLQLQQPMLTVLHHLLCVQVLHQTGEDPTHTCAQTPQPDRPIDRQKPQTAGDRHHRQTDTDRHHRQDRQTDTTDRHRHKGSIHRNNACTPSPYTCAHP